MTTSINSINAGGNAASETVTKKQSQLSDSTKKELEALGIPATDGMTEAEAQQKITQAKQEKQQQNGQQQGYSSEFEIKADAKSLAEELGISVSDDADISDILNEIGTEIEALLDTAENNPSVLSKVCDYFNKLSNLDVEYDNMVALQSNYENAMNMIAENNKIALGLS